MPLSSRSMKTAHQTLTHLPAAQTRMRVFEDGYYLNPVGGRGTRERRYSLPQDTSEETTLATQVSRQREIVRRLALIIVRDRYRFGFWFRFSGGARSRSSNKGFWLRKRRSRHILKHTLF